MNWQHLIYFKKVAECEHLTRASEELYISVSALSKAISNLEEELGIVLFEKSGRNIHLNRYGQMFYNYVSRATSEIEDGIHFIQRAASVYTGDVHISTIFSVGTNYLPELLSSFKQDYPQIHIELSQKTTSQILTELHENRIDLGFCSEFGPLEDYPSICRDLYTLRKYFWPSLRITLWPPGMKCILKKFKMKALYFIIMLLASHPQLMPLFKKLQARIFALKPSFQQTTLTPSHTW